MAREERERAAAAQRENQEEEDKFLHYFVRLSRSPIALTLKMSPVAEAQPALEAPGEAHEALAESKARSVISYSPDEIFQKSWQVREGREA